MVTKAGSGTCITEPIITNLVQEDKSFMLSKAKSTNAIFLPLPIIYGD